jgi:hypothetical protein
MVRTAKEWPWSSYRATAGFTRAYSCLTTGWVLSAFARQRPRAHMLYREFVQQGKNQPSVWEYLKNQVYLGSDSFVDDMLCKLDPEQSLKGIAKLQKQSPIKPLTYFEKRYSERHVAMAKAYLSGHYTLESIGQHFGVSYATVSRAVKLFEGQM